MMKFNYLVKVDQSDPLAAVKKLSQLVTGNQDAFVNVDATWVRKQDYLAAVPIAIALTVEMRAVCQANSPDTKFIVTGVTADNVASLVNDFGYTVHTTVPNEKLVVKEEKDEVQSAGQAINPETHEVKYWYNGKEISREEFEKKASKLEEDFKELWGEFGKRMMKLLK